MVLLKKGQCYRDKQPADVNTLWFYDRLTIYQYCFQFNSICVNEDFRENSWQKKPMTFNLAGQHEILYKAICVCVCEMCVFVYVHKGYIGNCIFQNLGQQTVENITFLGIFL